MCVCVQQKIDGNTTADDHFDRHIVCDNSITGQSHATMTTCGRHFLAGATQTSVILIHGTILGSTDNIWKEGSSFFCCLTAATAILSCPMRARCVKKVRAQVSL